MTDDTKTGKHLPFNDGLPTKPDVDLLIKTWPSPKVGDRFEYDAIEKLLGVLRAQARFNTVTWNWRKRLLEAGIVIECEPGQAFFVAAADQITGGTYKVLRGIGRKARTHRRKLAASIANAETDQQRLVIDHQARVMSALEKDAKKHRTNVLPSTAVPERPKIEPPKPKVKS